MEYNNISKEDIKKISTAENLLSEVAKDLLDNNDLSDQRLILYQIITKLARLRRLDQPRNQDLHQHAPA